jgi:hypothetical protein
VVNLCFTGESQRTELPKAGGAALSRFTALFIQKQVIYRAGCARRITAATGRPISLLKIEDGGVRAMNPSVVALLEQLGLMTPEAGPALAPFREPAILNHRKEEVGRIRPVFSLKSP